MSLDVRAGIYARISSDRDGDNLYRGTASHSRPHRAPTGALIRVADAAGMKGLLDTSLVAWLDHLKTAAESSA
jgi:hypothetical protein